MKTNILDFDSHAATQLSCLPCKQTISKTKSILRKIKRAAMHGKTYYETFKYIDPNVQAQLTNRGFEVSRRATGFNDVYFHIHWADKERRDT